jgi:hypothetical protein
MNRMRSLVLPFAHLRFAAAGGAGQLGRASSRRQSGPPSYRGPSILTKAGASPWRIQT